MHYDTDAPACFFVDVLRRADNGASPSVEHQLLIRRLKTTTRFRAGQTIFHQDTRCNGIYAVEKGVVAIRKRDAEGRAMIVRLVYSGDALGYRAYFAREPYSASAEALSDATISFISGADVDRLLRERYPVARELSARLARDLREAEDARLEASAAPVRARLARLLLTLKDRCATVDDEGELDIDLPLGRRDIAAMLGARPETIARAIRALQTRRVATFSGRTVHVPDLDKLMDEVETHRAA